MPFIFLHRYPFLRLLLPLIIGIVCGDFLYFHTVYISFLLFVGVSSFLFLSALLSHFLTRFSFRWLFGASVSLLFFVLGSGSMNLRLQETQYSSLQPEEVVRRVVLTGKPEKKEHSLLCRARTEEGKRVLLYLAPDSAAQQWQGGEVLLISARIVPPVNKGNPDEFDYVRYLSRKGIAGTAYVAAGRWRLLACRGEASLLQKALSYREKILDVYRKLGFEGDSFAVLSALTVGYKEELSEDIRETYSVSGASHVLALSGLHIGFLYALLCFVMRGLLRYVVAMRWLRAIALLLLLWSFAFFTGLSPSVVRSVIMFSLFALAGAFIRESISMNTLAATALFMLLACPGWVFDVGFQLSFCAVAAILLIYPPLYRRLPPGNRILKKVGALLAVSLVAQVGTAPLVLLYFSRFSTHFLLTNLLVVPLVSLIMYAAVLMLAATPFPAIQGVLAIGVRWLVEALNGSVRWIERLPFSSVDGVWTDHAEVFCFYLSVLLLLYYMVFRRRNCLLALGVCILAGGSYHLVRQVADRPHQCVRFYNVRGCAAVHCIAAGGRSWLAYADSVPDGKRLLRVASRYWHRHHLQVPVVVTGDYVSPDFSRQGGILAFGDKRVCIVNDNESRNKTSSQPLFIDYLYLCRGYSGEVEGLAGLFTIDTVILDVSLPDYRKEALISECRRLGIKILSLSDEGSLRFLL